MITTINRAIAKKNEENDKGFTLIELLVVILIIGVLAAIAIPAFLNQREGAWKSQVESDLKNAALAVEQHGVNNNGGFPAGSFDVSDPESGLVAGTDLAAAGFTATKDVGIKYTLVDKTSYKLDGVHKNSDKIKLSYESSTGKIKDTEAP